MTRQRPTTVAEAQAAARAQREGYATNTAMQRASLRRRADSGDDRAKQALNDYETEQQGADQ